MRYKHTVNKSEQTDSSFIRLLFSKMIGYDCNVWMNYRSGIGWPTWKREKLAPYMTPAREKQLLENVSFTFVGQSVIHNSTTELIELIFKLVYKDTTLAVSLEYGFRSVRVGFRVAPIHRQQVN